MSNQQPSENGYAPPSSQALLDVMRHDLGLSRREFVSTNEIPDRTLRSASTRQLDRAKEEVEKKRRVDPNREAETRAWASFQPEVDENGDGLQDIGGGGIARINKELKKRQDLQAQQGDLSSRDGRGGSSAASNPSFGSTVRPFDSISQAGHQRHPLKQRHAPPQRRQAATPQHQALPPGVIPKHLHDASLPFVKTERTPFRPLDEISMQPAAPVARLGHGTADMSPRLPHLPQQTPVQYPARPGTGRPLHERITLPPNSPLATTMSGFHSRRATTMKVDPEVIAKNTSKWATSQAVNVPLPAQSSPAVKNMPALTVQTSRPPAATPASRLVAISPPAPAQQPDMLASRVGRSNAPAASASIARSSSIASTATRGGAAHVSRPAPARSAALADPSTFLKMRDAKLGPAGGYATQEQAATAALTATTATAVTSQNDGANGNGPITSRHAISATNSHTDNLDDGRIAEDMSKLSVADAGVVDDTAPTRQTYTTEEFLTHRQRKGVLGVSAKSPPLVPATLATASRPVFSASVQSKPRTLGTARPTMDSRARGLIVDGITQKVPTPKPIEMDLIDLEGFDVPQATYTRPTVPMEMQGLMFPTMMPDVSPPAVQSVVSPPTLRPAVTPLIAQPLVPPTPQPRLQQAPPPVAKTQTPLFAPGNTGMGASKWA